MVQWLKKNPPSNAGNVSSIPGQGTKIPHAVEQLSPQVATTGVGTLLNPCYTTREFLHHPKDPVCCNYDPMQPNKCKEIRIV